MDGDREREYREFVLTQWPPLFRTAYLLTGDHQHAEDLLQTALVKVYLAWPRVSRVSHPLAYTRRVLVNQASSWWRRRQRTELVVPDPPEPADPGFADALVDARVVWQAVLRLPVRQRAVVVLRYYEDLAESEIAEVLGVAPGTVKAHAHAARAALRDQLGPLHPSLTSGDQR